MSVQFGKCNFDGKPIDPKDLDDARAMLAVYGPDSEGTILQDNFGILYRAFHTTTESRGEAQPYALQSGALITWDGRLDNRKDLIEKLAPKISTNSADVEIVAAGYERSGTGILRDLIGDWALSVWNPKEQSLLLAKDFIGTRHLYYCVRNDAVTWCSILDPLLVSARKPLELEEEFIAAWFSFFPATHLTPYVGIHSVPPSAFVLLEREKQKITKYWDFNPSKKIRHRVDADYEEHFRIVFSESVRRRLRSDSPVLAELSGGMDSSSVVCMADEILSEGNGLTPRLDTVSYYTDSEPNWDERRFFTRVEAQRGRVGAHIEVRAEDTFRFDFDMSRIAATPSSGSCSSNASQSFARVLQINRNRTLLSGVGGDEFTGGVPNPIPELADLLVELDFRGLAHQLNMWALDKRKPWFHLLASVVKRFIASGSNSNRQATLGQWLNTDFLRRYRSAIGGYSTRWQLFGPYPTFQDHTATVSALQRQLAGDSLPSDPLFERRYPYLDRDFLEFLAAVPAEQLIRPGQRRSLMRRALAGYVPQELLFRKRKAHVMRAPMIGIASNYERINWFCSEMCTSSLGFTDESVMRAFLLKASHGLEIPVIPFIRTVAIEWWLRNLQAFGIIELDRAETRNTLRVFAQRNRRCS